ncbi:hypothetical protein B0H19DRAFT_713112 [Mycena capillaripes]|nr:hypothetical protein B0H19DRAFT_713112 [Mycena capillaripes]
MFIGWDGARAPALGTTAAAALSVLLGLDAETDGSGDGRRAVRVARQNGYFSRRWQSRTYVGVRSRTTTPPSASGPAPSESTSSLRLVGEVASGIISAPTTKSRILRKASTLSVS